MARSAAACAAVTVAGTALFIFLHWLGNLTPYETVRQRLSYEMAANGGTDRGYFDGSRELFNYEFCEMAAMALAGAGRDGSDGAASLSRIANAVAPLTLRNVRDESGGVLASGCPPSVGAAVAGYESDYRRAKARYWWGGKAAFAIGLRWLSVFEYYRLIALATFAGWVALAAALSAFGWRAAVVGAPFAVFGIWMSGVVYFADAANGPATAWAVWSVAILALMMRWRTAARRAPLFCFGAGMASSYLWLADGHNAIAIFGLGLAAWLGYSRLKADGAARRAAGCVALWIVGFAACFSLGLAVKFSLPAWQDAGRPAAATYDRAIHRLNQAWREALPGVTGDGGVYACAACVGGGWRDFPVARDIRGLWMMTPLSDAEDKALLGFSAAALALAAALAAWRAADGDRKPLRAVLFIAGLAALALSQLLSPSDTTLRNERLAFIILAACWVCLALTASESGRKAFWAAAGCLALLAAGGVSLAHPASVYALEREIAGERPAVRAKFDVYLSQDGRRVIYRRDDCAESDIASQFFLHAFPADGDGDGYWGMNFGGTFNIAIRRGLSRVEARGGRCLFARGLPDYPIAKISTGQFEGDDRLWWIEMAGDMRVPEGEPAARGGVFDIHLDGDNRLIYAAEDCSESDTRGRFFLSVFPKDAADLSERSKARGLDHDPLNFEFKRRGAVWDDGECAAVAALPGYEFDEMETWQFVPGEGELWRAKIPDDAAVPDSAPAARGGVFDLHLVENRLIYVAKHCVEDDTRGRFFLSAIPKDAADLSEDSKARGLEHDSFNFDFKQRAGAADGECKTVRYLPEYAIDSIETGQFVPGEGEAWRAKIPDDAAVPDGEPTARGGVFDLHLVENRLIYAAERCAEDDTRGRFFLSVFPKDADDLSEDSRTRGLGHDSFNFDFKRHDKAAEGECKTVRYLPEYAIDAVETGQFAPGEGELWKVRLEVGD